MNIRTAKTRKMFGCTKIGFMVSDLLTYLLSYLLTYSLTHSLTHSLGMKNGVIMESGALNGVLFSNSLMFEQFANWTSINVEADPG